MVNNMNYLETIDNRIKEYFRILEPNYPDWLDDYINTDILLKQQYISVTCGTIYSKLFDSSFFFSSLDHSIAVALICWHFTHNKKITLSGLFHDVATPVFKHCVDFMNGDYTRQESTEELTTKIIKESKEVMSLLKRDCIDISEIDNYHTYPIADNDTPKLSSDRLEYSLSNALFTYNIIDKDTVEKIYNDIYVQKNELEEQEIGFKNEKVALEFVKITTKLSIIYREDKTRYSMQFIADILKRLNNERLIKVEDLYNMKESDVIDIINRSRYSDVFNKWKNATKVKTSTKEPKNVYYVHHGAKIRYIDPLINEKRISEVNIEAKKIIEKNLSYDMNNYIYLDFNL